MGRLFYGYSHEAIVVPDHTLAHLGRLASTKLRRSESFTVTFRHGDDGATRKTTIWLHCSIPLRFEFDSDELGPLDRSYLEELAHGAASAGGILVDVPATATVSSESEHAGARVPRLSWAA